MIISFIIVSSEFATEFSESQTHSNFKKGLTVERPFCSCGEQKMSYMKPTKTAQSVPMFSIKLGET